MLNQDYKEMLQCLLQEKVKFLLVGASLLTRKFGAGDGYLGFKLD